MKTPLQILIDARALIDSPEKWCKHSNAISKDGEPLLVLHPMACAFCSWGATERAEGHEIDNLPSGMLARKILNQAIDHRTITGWNDAPERTHAEVLAAFDTAIALARQAEAQP